MILSAPVLAVNRWIVVAIVALLVAGAMGGCAQDAKVQPGVTEIGNDIPTQTSFNTSMRFTSEGSIRAILRAGRIRIYDPKQLTLLDSNVHVDFYNQQGQHSSQLFSKTAVINDVTKTMTAYTRVHIVSDSGTVVDTDSLVWDNKTQMLHSDAAVRIAEANRRITTGIGFESDQNLSHYRILRPTIVAPSQTMTSPSASQPSNQTNAPQPALPQSTFGSPPKNDPFHPASPFARDTTKR